MADAGWCTDGLTIHLPFYKSLARNGSYRHANTTGDGFVLVCAGDLVATEPYRLLDFSHHVLDISSKFGALQSSKRKGWSMHVRIGIHTGKFFFNCPAFDSPTALGTGVNMASRICGLAGAGQVVVSEAFYDDYQNHHASDKSKAYRHFDELWEARVKHNLRLPVRQYRHRSDDGGTLFGTDELCPALEAQRLVKDQVITQLKYFLSELEQHICRLIDSQPDRIRLRTSILLPDVNNKQLTISEFRVRYDSEKERPSRATFSIDPTRPTGIPGFCYTSKEAVAITDLPDYEKNRAEYIERFKRFNLREEYFANQHGRRARSFISVPIRCEVSNSWIVLSLDAADPLWPESDDRTSDLVDRVRRLADRLIAPQWDLWLKT